MKIKFEVGEQVRIKSNLRVGDFAGKKRVFQDNIPKADGLHTICGVQPHSSIHNQWGADMYFLSNMGMALFSAEMLIPANGICDMGSDCFPPIKVALDKGAIRPTRAHSYDAGLDLYTPYDVTIPAGPEITTYTKELPEGKIELPENEGTPVCVDTGVHIQIPKGYVGFITSKSGLMAKGITCRGTIDAGYTGSIRAVMYNNSSKDYHFKAGDKVTQLVIVKCVCCDVEIVDSLEDTDRGEGGFGSTGR